MRKKLIPCRRTYSDHIISRQRPPDPLQLELTDRLDGGWILTAISSVD